MPLTSRGSSTSALSADMRRLLIDGPWAIGLRLRQLPPHDDLRAIWAVHGAEIVRSLQNEPRAWFMQRDLFVSELRRED